MKQNTSFIKQCVSWYVKTNDPEHLIRLSEHLNITVPTQLNYYYCIIKNYSGRENEALLADAEYNYRELTRKLWAEVIKKIKPFYPNITQYMEQETISLQEQEAIKDYEDKEEILGL